MVCKLSLKQRTLFFSFAALAIAGGSALAADKNTIAALSHYIIASLYDRQGQTDKAISEYKAALKSDAENSAIRISLASSYIKNNDIPKAIEELNLAVKLDPEAVEPHALLAILFSMQDNLSGASREYEAALRNASKIEPRNVQVYRALGAIYQQQKKYRLALEMYRLAAELTPNDAQLHFFIADTYDQLGERLAAEKELKKSLELNPDYAEALNYLGYLYVEENKNLAAAELMIKKALELDPQNAAYLDSLGWLYFKRGNVREALRFLEQASSLLEDAVIFSHLGDAYFRMRDFQKAIASWEKSLQLDPGEEIIKQKIEDALQRKPGARPGK
jgi:Tfp pilus assembly protein PilF